MRLFISHSWRDKTTADQLARDLGSMAEVWQDIEQLKPGDQIQPTIDEALAGMDLVVLLWSKHAAASDKGVIPEIEKSLELEKTIIPCLLDDTELRDELDGTLAIDFHSYEIGFGRLCIVILRHLGGDLGVEMQEELDAITDIEGALKYVHDYRNKQGISGSDRDYWIERVVTAMNALFERLTRLQGRLQSAGDFIQQVYGKLEEAGEDRAKVQEILQEVIRNEHLAPDLMPRVRGHIEQYLRTLPEPQAPAAPAQDLGARAARLAGNLRPADQARQQIQARLRGQVAPAMLPSVTDLLHEYLSSARQTLDALSRVGTAYQSAAVAQAVQFLLMYLEEPNDLIPESQHGIWGYLDDAWLIHNTAYRLVEAGLLPASAFAVPWERIASADPIATACLPPVVRYELENYLQQLLGVIVAEVQSYSPQFTHQGHSYHPNMGQAQAVGGMGREMRTMYDSMQNDLAQISLNSWSNSITTDWAESQGGYTYEP